MGGQGRHVLPMTKVSSDDGQAFWRRHARRYDRVALLLNRRFGKIGSLAAEDLRECRGVLEVAAGTGLVTASLAREVEKLVAKYASGSNSFGFGFGYTVPAQSG